MEALPLDDEELDDELEELEEFVPEDELEELEEFVPEDELEELELELEDELVTVPGEELSPPQAVNPSASSTTPPKRNDCFFKLIIMIGALYGLLRLVQALGIYYKNPLPMRSC